MSVISRLAWAGLCCSPLFGCGSSETEDIASAKKLLAAARNDHYQTFLRAPGWEQVHRPATTPRHGNYVDIYANNVLQFAVGAGPPWPNGTFLVEEGWSDAEGTQPYRIAILHKGSDGAWFAAEYDPTDKVLAAGESVEECDSCHDKGEDYALGF